MNRHFEESDQIAEALAQCEAEPIRTPDRIQPHGALVAFDQTLNRITHVSANIADYTGSSAAVLLGAGVGATLGRVVEHAVRNALSVATIDRQREFLGLLPLDMGPAQACLHRRGDRVLLELTRETAGTDAFGLQRLRWLLTRQGAAQRLDEALDGMVRNLRAITGYDRVMAYRFRPDGSGEVVAEARTLAVESYLNLRFPSFDIPKSARDICLEQPVRCIADTSAADVPLLTLDANAPPLDMTLAEYRGTSPVHLQYLRNMDVGASLTLPIIEGGTLWGLFACHNRTAKRLGLEETLTFDLVGQIMNAAVGAILRRRNADTRARCLALMQRLDSDARPAPDGLFPETAWQALAAETLHMFRADGLLLEVGERRQSAGLQPPEGTLGRLSTRLTGEDPDAFSCAGNLMADTAHFAPVAGALLMPIDTTQDARLWLFRAEENETVTWAGSPDKEIEVTAKATRLHPRSSFQSYRQNAKGCSKAWEPDELELAQSYAEALGLAVRQQLERTSDRQLRDLKVQELDHRLRNLLSLVRALGQQSAQGKAGVAGFLADFDARLAALTEVQGLSGEEQAPTDIARLVARGLKPFDAARVKIDGPPVSLSPAAATIMAMVLQELATNAAKHGALADEAGTVDLNWRQADDGLHIDWRETASDSYVLRPRQTGFGTYLITEGLAHQVGGSGDIRFDGAGIRVAVHVPSAHLVPDATGPVAADDGTLPVAGSGSTKLGRVLLLEDDFLIAAGHRDELLATGAEAVVLAGSNDAARLEIERHRPDCAILDVALAGEDCRGTATLLAELGIPFVFLSGDPAGADWQSGFPGVPVLAKPASADAFVTAFKAE